jgi:hydrogenase maturation factor
MTMPRGTLHSGKLPFPLLRELLASPVGLPAEVKLGPAIGEDACAIEVPGGVLIAGTDPITLTSSSVGAHAVLCNANDVAVMGVRPRWFLAAVLLPEGTSEDDVRALFRMTREALAQVGASLVGGHTEVTSAVTQPVVVGQMLGLSTSGHFVRSGGLGAGDVVLQVGAAPVEGAAVLAAEARDLSALPQELVARARAALREPGISVVEPALLAADLGATALHDPTEGGLAMGLYELAEASGLALRVATGEVLWFEPGCAICRAVGADPWGTLASGTLLAGFPGARAEAASSALGARGFQVRTIARVEPGSGVADEPGRALPRFERDEVARVLESGPAEG